MFICNLRDPCLIAYRVISKYCKLFLGDDVNNIMGSDQSDFNDDDEDDDDDSDGDDDEDYSLDEVNESDEDNFKMGR